MKIDLVFILSLSLMACAHSETDLGTSSTEKPKAAPVAPAVVKHEVVKAKTDSKLEALAQAEGDSVVSNLRFKKGQDQLDTAAQNELEKAIKNAKLAGEIADVQVVVWSDQEYPAKTDRLPSNQIKLAKQRGSQIEKYLKEKLDVRSVTTHNMAQPPKMLSSYFNSADARLKEKLIAEGFAPTTADAPAGKGRASTALILIKTK